MLGTELGHGDGRQYTLRSPISGQVIELTGAPGRFLERHQCPDHDRGQSVHGLARCQRPGKRFSSVFVGQPPGSRSMPMTGNRSRARCAMWGQVSIPIPARSKCVSPSTMLPAGSGRACSPRLFSAAGPTRRSSFPHGARAERLQYPCLCRNIPLEFEPRICQDGRAVRGPGGDRLGAESRRAYRGERRSAP